MYHVAKKYHPLYLEKMNEIEQLTNNDESTVAIYDKGGKYKFILNNLIATVKECQQKYGGKTELATEKDELIVKLCDAWEESVSYGIKIPQLSILKNMQDIVSGNNINEPNFWEFCRKHLTNHEKERFETLLNVWTPRGKTKALIRAALNERSLERYILMWLSDPLLAHTFEPWSLMLNKEASSLLSPMAASLNSILFAVSVDTPDINITKTGIKKTEPIVYTPAPVGPSKKQTAINRQIISLEDNDITNQNNEAKDKKILTKTSAVEEIHVDNINVIAEQNVTGSEDSAVDVLEHFVSQNVIDSSDVNTIHSDDDSNLLESSPVNNSSITPDVSSETSSYFSRHNSLRSSIGSTSAATKAVVDFTQLEEKLKEMTEKCTFLEAKIAELSLENRRLHRLMNHSSASENWQFLVSIPYAKLLKSGSKNYYAYEIHINFTNNPDELIVLRRYSEFYKLHQKYKKNNVLMKALDFPPKKKIGNMDVTFVEERRQRLQIYLRHLLTILPEISNCTTKFQLLAAFPFLRQC